MKRAIIFGLLTLMTACEPGDLVTLPSAPRRITILSYNQVGDPWFIILATTSKTTSRFTFDEGLPDAVVTIYEDGDFQEQLAVDTTADHYSSDAHIVTYFRSATGSPQPGHQYKIVVESEGYPTATAEYTQPNAVPADISFGLRERKPLISRYAISDNTGTHVFYDTTTQWIFDVAFTFTDPPEDNFYDFWIRTAFEEDSLDTHFGEGYLSVDGDPMTTDPFLGGQIIDDKDFAGKQVTLKFILTLSNDKYPPSLPVETWSWFRISLRSMNEAQYKFNIQTRKQQLVAYDPYAQPITTFTNVENGLGVFGGYTPYSKTFYYKVE